MTSSASPPVRRWLFGPAPDLLFGCGLAYAAVFVALALAGESIRNVLPMATLLVPVSLVASAHYGATALRAYSRAEDRRRYAMFTVWTTLVLGLAFAAGVRWEIAGSLFITAYLTWSPWHYAGQNFGVAMTFLRRRGIDVTPRARRLLHTSFVTSFLLALLAIHGAEPQASYAPDVLHGDVYSFVSLGPLLGVPSALSRALFVLAGLVYAASTLGAVAMLRRGRPLRDLAPVLALVFTQALWFSVPSLARELGVLGQIEPLGLAQAEYAFLWIGAGHALQYLWITAYFARARGQSRSHSGFLFRALIAGTSLWFVPAVLFAPGMLGRVPYDAGLAVMVAALVNLHHFVLDGVIWKLRDGPVARFLLGVRGSDAATAGSAQRRPHVAWRAAFWIVGLATLALNAATVVLPASFEAPLLAGDLAAAERGDARLDAIGQASADRRLQLGQEALTRGDLERAERHLRRSIDLLPSAWAWVGLGDTHARREQWVRASEAYAAALDIEPYHPIATFHAGVTALRMGRHEDAERLLTLALDIAQRHHDAPPELLGQVQDVLAELNATRR